MKEYVCTVCGYVHKGELVDDFICPVCKAGRDAFRLKESENQGKKIEKPHFDKKLSAMETSIIFSNLARGCEKQYMQKEAEAFLELANFFKSKAKNEEVKPSDEILSLINEDLSSYYVYANLQAENCSDRGAKRALLWSEKVTNMLKSLLTRYKAEGDKMLEHTSIYVCSICGYVYLGDNLPEACPVCKVPSWKFEKVQGR